MCLLFVTSYDQQDAITHFYHQNVLVLPLLYVWAGALSTVLSSKLINMHKGNYRSGLLPLLGAGVGGAAREVDAGNLWLINN